MSKAYRVLAGLNYPPNGKGDEVRAEPGDVVTDLPPKSIAALLEQGDIEAAGDTVKNPYVVGERGPEINTAGLGTVISKGGE